MDPQRFDTLTCSLTDTRSRRGALAALLGGTLGLLGLGDAPAKKKGGGGGGGKKKGSGRKRGSGTNTGSGTTTGAGASFSLGNGQSCSTSTQCAGALCASGLCQACGLNGDCGSDAGGTCFCGTLTLGGTKVCVSQRFTNTSPISNCGVCPPNTRCITQDPTQGYDCFKACGAP